jgi:hypothetical protein
MPLHHGCRLDQYHGVDDLRPDPVEPHDRATKAEAGRAAVAAARPADDARQSAQFPARRGCENGRRRAKQRRRESTPCPRRYGWPAKITSPSRPCGDLSRDSQRLARAKTKIRQARIAFEIPAADQIPQRLEAVLNAIYAAYGSSWEDAAGRDQRAVGLAEEAIWLARVLRDAIPDEPEVRGLLALLLHREARRPARRGADGRFVPLSEQDPHIWLAPLIDEAERELAVSAAHARLGRFQIEAAIQSVHAERARTGRTDWAAIATFYDQLTRLAPSIGAAVARAAALCLHGRRDGHTNQHSTLSDSNHCPPDHRGISLGLRAGLPGLVRPRVRAMGIRDRAPARNTTLAFWKRSARIQRRKA